MDNTLKWPGKFSHSVRKPLWKRLHQTFSLWETVVQADWPEHQDLFFAVWVASFWDSLSGINNFMYLPNLKPRDRNIPPLNAPYKCIKVESSPFAINLTLIFEDGHEETKTGWESVLEVESVIEAARLERDRKLFDAESR